jgi:hypothetical protein
MAIAGTEGLSPEQLSQELAHGAKFVVFEYTISIVILSFKRVSKVHFVRAGEGAAGKSLPYTLLSLAFGWWGFPWGIIYTIQSLITNLSGGRDVTGEMTRGR